MIDPASNLPGLDFVSAHQWRDVAGNPMVCEEKQTALTAALFEVGQSVRDALDDALLMGCREADVREILLEITRKVAPTVKERQA